MFSEFEVYGEYLNIIIDLIDCIHLEVLRFVVGQVNPTPLLLGPVALKQTVTNIPFKMGYEPHPSPPISGVVVCEVGVIDVPVLARTRRAIWRE